MIELGRRCGNSEQRLTDAEMCLTAKLFLPGVSALGAGLSDEDALLVDRPTDDEALAVGAVAEGVGLVAICFDVFEGVGDQSLDVFPGGAGFPHGSDGFQHELECLALSRDIDTPWRWVVPEIIGAPEG